MTNGTTGQGSEKHDVDASIGAALSGYMDLSVRTTVDLAGLGRAAGQPSDREGFAAVLADSFAARAARLGLQLPGASATTTHPHADPDSVDALWQRARIASIAAGHGPGDAMLESLSAARAGWPDR